MSRLDPNTKGLIIAAVSLGSFLAFIPASYLADIYGRRLSVAIGSTLVITASVIQVAVQKHWVFFGARVMTGIGMGLSQTAAPLLITETAHPRQRRTLTSLYNAVWFCGSITAAGIVFSTLFIHNDWSWRVPCMLQAFFPLFQLTGLSFIPESPRWLVAKNRKADALAMLTRYHANGNPADKLVRDEYDQICSSISAESDIRSASRWSTFLKTKGNLHRLTICILLGFMQEWTGNGRLYIHRVLRKICLLTSPGVTSYYLPPILASVGIKDAIHQAAVNISLQVWNLKFAVAGASTSDKHGRRTLWLSATTLMLIFLSTSETMAGLFAEMEVLAAGIAVVPMLFLFCAAYDFAYMPLFIAYPAEILPFQLRAKGLAITLTMDSLACFFNQYVNPMAFHALRWRYFSIYVSCLVVVLALVYLFFPETQGKSLEEVSQIFEKKEVVEGGSSTDSEGSQEVYFMKSKV